MTEIEAILVEKQMKMNLETGDKATEALLPKFPVTTEIELTDEAKQLALEYTLKVLAELGFQLFITEEDYKKLDDIAIAKSII